jgi:hypothetical protein
MHSLARLHTLRQSTDTQHYQPELEEISMHALEHEWCLGNPLFLVKTAEFNYRLHPLELRLR